MVILHIAYVVNDKANGVSVVVPRYVREQSKSQKVALLNISDEVIKDKTNNLLIFNNYDSNKSILEQLEEPFNKPDIVIFHEIYRYKFIKMYKELLSNNIPYIIIPHGSLNKVAQRKGKIKKIVGNVLLFKSFVKNASKVQFLTEKEKKMSLKYNNNCYILGNGMDILDKSKICINKKKSEFVFIYIGRFDIKVKGIDVLLRACKLNYEFMKKNNIVMEFYGKNSGKKDGRKYISNYIKENALSETVKLKSEIYDEKKIKKILESDIFIQTSRNEGQPLSLLEVLGYGIPVIVTPRH